MTRRFGAAALGLAALSSACAMDEGTRFASFEEAWVLTACTIIEDNRDQ